MEKPKYTKKKPHFINIEEIQPGKHCYHIYGKIMSVEESDLNQNSGNNVKVLTGKIGDKSGVANFLLKGDHAQNLSEGDIVAFRNGKSNVVNDYIRLEMDRFGKITKESVEIGSVDESNDISSVAYVLQKK